MNIAELGVQMFKDDGGRKKLPQRYVLLLIVTLIAPATECFAGWTPLADTGQTMCYDTNGIVIICPEAGEALSGQDAQYQAASPAYLDNDDQTVTDLQSGLIWTKSSKGKQHTWHDAISYCDELVFAKQTDWRLPGKFELESIVDYGKFFPASNQVFDCEGSFYWSSTPHAGNPEYAWSVFCNDGADHWVHKTNNYYVRCVRTGR